MSNKRLLTATILLISGLITQWLAQPDARHNDFAPTATPRPAPDGLIRVVKVVDGDTIEIDNGEHVRYVGINTPETVDPRRAPQCFGKEASDYNKQLLSDGFVRLERDISDKDKYGRLLRYVYASDGTFINLALVRNGYAQVSTYPPDITHAKEFTSAQAQARAEGLGLWSACPGK